jgi:hypothetical protein
MPTDYGKQKEDLNPCSLGIAWWKPGAQWAGCSISPRQGEERQFLFLSPFVGTRSRAWWIWTLASWLWVWLTHWWRKDFPDSLIPCHLAWSAQRKHKTNATWEVMLAAFNVQLQSDSPIKGPWKPLLFWVIA